MTHTFKLDKLVRDNTYEIMTKNGGMPAVKKLEIHAELIKYFRAKIVEEAKEVFDAQNSDELISELTDLQEVIYGFIHALEVSKEKFNEERQRKYNIRGGFERGLAIDTLTLDKTHPMAEYYRKDPKKYLKVKL